MAGHEPVVVDVYNPGLMPMKTLTARVMDLGAASVMIDPPHGLKGDEAVENHFRAVFDPLR